MLKAILIANYGKIHMNVNNNSDELIKLIKNLIHNKSDLIQLLDEKGIKLSKSITYDEIISRVGEKELLKLFGFRTIQEGYRKLDIINLINKSNLNEVSLLAKELGVQKKNKAENIKEIFLLRNEEQISNAIKILFKTKKLLGIYQYLKIVSGPKGIIDSCYEHQSDVVQFVDSLKESELKQIYRKLEIKEEASTVNEMKQLILANSSDENIIKEVNKLISNRLILIDPSESPELSIIMTSCGLFQREEWKNPKLELRDLLLKKVDKDDLKLVIAKELKLKKEVDNHELERYLLEYLLDKSPEDIIHSFFDKPDIIRLAESIFKCKPNDDISFEEIINCILSTLGFIIPPKLIGLKSYKEQIIKILDKTMFTMDDATTIARETDRVLRNLIQFSSKFIWEIEEKNYRKILTEKCDVDKDFNKLSSGELIRILRVMDENIKKDNKIKQKLYLEFGQKYLISTTSLKILDKWVSHRNGVIKRNEKLDRKIIEDLIEFADNIKDIYPLIVRVEKEETDKYDTHFIYLIDDKGAEHRISLTHYLETIPYFMSPSNRTIVDPFIVEIE